MLTVSVNYLKNFHHNVLMVYSGLGSLIEAIIFSSLDPDSKIFHNLTNIDGVAMRQIFCLVFLSLLALTMAIVSYQLVSPPIGGHE